MLVLDLGKSSLYLSLVFGGWNNCACCILYCFRVTLQQVQTSPLEVFELLLISDIMMRVVNSISSAFGIYNKYMCFDP